MNNELLYNYNLKCIFIKKNRQKYQITNGNDDFSSFILSTYVFALLVKMLRDISVHMSPRITSCFSGILNKFISQSCGLETGLIKVSHRSKGLRGRKETLSHSTYILPQRRGRNPYMLIAFFSF